MKTHTEPGSIRVVMADDHNLVRAGLRSLLEQLDGFEVVGEAADGHAALQVLGQRAADLLLLDLALPGLNGIEVAARVAREHPSVRVLILSMHATEEHVLRALRMGVAGYVLKDASVAELELALRAVMQGQTYLSPSVSRTLLDDYLKRLDDRQAPRAASLTPRQREILQLVAEGRSTKEIAFQLELSVKTVETHRVQLMERLGIHDVPGLVRYAIRTGLTSLDG